MVQNEVISQLSIDSLIPNEFQPRKVFNEQSLQELSQSIKEYGIINPILARPKNDKYEIIAGERRLRAAKLAGLTEVPVIIRNIDDNKMIEIAIIENLQQEDVSAIEEAETYQNIMAKSSINEQQLSEKLGKSQNFINNKLRLLELPVEVKEALKNRKINEKYAKILLQIKTTEKQIELLNRVIENKLSIRDLENIIENEKIEKKEEKESDTMNNDNFFPNMNQPVNNDISLNTMNMQAMNGVGAIQPTANMNQPPILDPNVIQFQNPVDNGFNQPNNMINSQELPTAPLPQPTMNNNLAMPQSLPQENKLPENNSFLTNNDGLNSLSQQAVDNNQETTPPASPIPDIPLFSAQDNIAPPEPVQTQQPLPPEPLVATQPEIAPVLPTTDAPLFPTISNEAVTTNNNSFNVPVATGEEDQYTKLINLLNANGIQYKSYSNEQNHCVIIEI